MVLCSLQSSLVLLLIVVCADAASHRIARPVTFYYGNSGPGDLQVSAAEIKESFVPSLPAWVDLHHSAPSAAGSEIVEQVVQQPKGFVPKPKEDSKTAESLILKFEEKLKKGTTIADQPTIIADAPAQASVHQKRQVKTKSNLEASPIVVADESPSSYARRVHKMETAVPQLAQNSEQHQARVAPPKGVVKKKRVNAAKQGDGKAAESKVTEQQAQGSDHHDDKHEEKNEHHEHGGGKKHHDEHHGVHGDKGHKDYKGHHDYAKVEHGHHDKEGHKGHYHDEGGHKKKHHDEHDHYGEHHEGEEGDKGAKVNKHCF